jgi:hypothetical protein
MLLPVMWFDEIFVTEKSGNAKTVNATINIFVGHARRQGFSDTGFI